MKYPRASGALRQAPDPMLKRTRFARKMLLRTIGNLGLSRSGPPWSNPRSAPDFIQIHATFNNFKYVQRKCYTYYLAKIMQLVTAFFPTGNSEPEK